MSFLIDPPLLYASSRAYGAMMREAPDGARDGAFASAGRVMRRGAVALAAGFLVAACGAASGQPIHSGITGRVVAGPTCPVERVPPEPQCAPRPLAARLQIRREGGSGMGHIVRSASDGRFHVVLAPGTYIVTPLAQSGSPFPRPGPSQTVRVRSRRFTHITVTYDTGIR